MRTTASVVGIAVILSLSSCLNAQKQEYQGDAVGDAPPGDAPVGTGGCAAITECLVKTCTDWNGKCLDDCMALGNPDGKAAFEGYYVCLVQSCNDALANAMADFLGWGRVTTCGIDMCNTYHKACFPEGTRNCSDLLAKCIPSCKNAVADCVARCKADYGEQCKKQCESSAIGFCLYDCFATSTYGAQKAFIALGTCGMNNKCVDQAGSSNDLCFAQHCGMEYLACQNAK